MSARAVWRCVAMMALPALGACHPSPAPVAAPLGAEAGLRALDGTRWVWASAECSDGSLQLGQVGLERELTVHAEPSGAATLILETELATEGCSASAEWLALPRPKNRFRFEPRSLLSLPPDTDCGAVERSAMNGTIVVRGDELELVTRRSAWCRGFDARFVYQRAKPQRLSPTQVVTRYVGAFNRRDPQALARLFVTTGSLVEPFSPTGDGNYRRHEGRSAIAAFYANAFRSVPWSALRLNRVGLPNADGHIVAEWEYMDPGLEAPLHGRNLFVIAGGEIYEAELQLVDDPRPARPVAHAPEAERSAAGIPSTGPGTGPTVRP